MADQPENGQRPSLADQLDKIAVECAHDGWDSYGGRGITAEAVYAAKVLLRSLAVVPTVNGGIQFDMGAESVAFELNAKGVLVAMTVDADSGEDYVRRVKKREDESHG